MLHSKNEKMKAGKDSSKSILFARRFLRLAILSCVLAALGILFASCTSNPNSQEQTNSQYEQTSNKGTTNNDPTPSIDTTRAIRSTVNGNTQFVTSSLTATSYDPILVKEGIPVQWTLKVPEGSLNACNNEIIIPEYEINVVLEVGDNVITFMPVEAGTFEFCCWMEMIFSYIAVEDKDGNIPPMKDGETWRPTPPCCLD